MTRPLSTKASGRYWLFQYTSYYPSGGWNDFVDSFESIEDAKKHPTGIAHGENAEIVDIDTAALVSEGHWVEVRKEFKWRDL